MKGWSGNGTAAVVAAAVVMVAAEAVVGRRGDDGSVCGRYEVAAGQSERDTWHLAYVST
ncbi:hypothetical protein Tco_0736358, partial [Tanacetum coccineum]